MRHDSDFAFAWTDSGSHRHWGDAPAHEFFIPRAFWRRFGPGGPRGPRMFGRGDMKYALLNVLAERPMHGYELIRAFEERSGGVYVPSPGVIYPTLQLLEDQGWVTSETKDGKKTYTITEAGQAALRDRIAESPEGHRHQHGPFGHHGPRGPFGREAPAALRDLGEHSLEVAHLMRQAVFATRGDPARLAQLQAIVDQARTALQGFLAEQGPSPSGQPRPHTGNDTPLV